MEYGPVIIVSIEFYVVVNIFFKNIFSHDIIIKLKFNSIRMVMVLLFYDIQVFQIKHKRRKN